MPIRTTILGAVPVLLALGGVLPVRADSPKPVDGSKKVVTIAVIGDTPYGAEQVVDLPNLITDINADARVDRVVHVGDIKNGSTRCDDAYYAAIADQFTSFEDPLVYTPGDNEWTDCHRATNGKYDPLGRLELLREVFFAQPNLTLGAPSPLFTQADSEDFADVPENVAWVESRVVFATLHAVGSRNGLAPWFGDDTTDALIDEPARRIAEVEHRTEAALAWLDHAFALADKNNVQGVVLFMQADTWPGSSNDGFASIVARLAELTLAFDKPVLVVQGDSHRFKVDQPLLAGDATHGVAQSVPNLTRIVVEGETTAEYLALRIDPRNAPLFSWERVQR